MVMSCVGVVVVCCCDVCVVGGVREGGIGGVCLAV